MRSIILAAAVLALACGQAQAWAGKGHMIIAAIAYDALEAPVAARAGELLRLNPDWHKWTDGVAAEEDKERYAFVHAATWADDIKSAAGYSDEGDFADAPEAARNIGYADTLRHKYWHYDDLDFSPDGTPLPHEPEVNALSEILILRAALASQASDDVKSYDLAWLLHIVGDAHQPLHATSRFTAALAGDRGGNAESVVTTTGRTLALHAFWDDLLGEHATVGSAIAAAAALPPADPGRAAIADPAAWFAESAQLAKDHAYAAPIGPGAGPFQLDAAYESQAHALAEQQAAVAGQRLANLLNAALK